MHPEVAAWLAARAAELATPKRVLEIGSRNINGSARDAWPGVEWLGVDLLDGPGVDLVADAAAPDFLARVAKAAGMGQERLPSGGLAPGFDLVVCCEVLEHAEDPAGVVRGAVRALRSGRTLLVTCAAPDREPHSATDGGPLQPGEHYRNIDWPELRDWLVAAGCDDPRTTYFPERGDLYASATKQTTRRKRK